MSDNIRLEKSRNIYELWRTGEGDMAELAIGLYDLTAHYEALLVDADALLAVVPKLEFLAEISGSFCIYPDKEIEHVGAAVVRKIAKEALADLPEHLKDS